MCTACGFSLGALSAQMGIPPQLTPPIADLDRVLLPRQRRALAEAIDLLEKRFPDIVCVVVITQIPESVAPEIYAFWLYNRGSLFSTVEQGGSNHGVLLLIDSEKPRAAVMIGYGLEPFVSPSLLDLCLQSASPLLLRDNIGAAAEAFFKELAKQLLVLSDQWPATFGYSDDVPWFDSATGELLQVHKPEQAELY